MIELLAAVLTAIPIGISFFVGLRLGARRLAATCGVLLLAWTLGAGMAMAGLLS